MYVSVFEKGVLNKLCTTFTSHWFCQKWPKYRVTLMHFTDCYRGSLFPVEMQHLPQLMSLFPVNSSLSSSIAHPTLRVWLLMPHNCRFSTELSAITLRHHFPATINRSCHMADTGGAPCHQILEATPIVTRAERVLGFPIVWSCWARDSVASKTHWDCDRLCLRRLFPPLRQSLCNHACKHERDDTQENSSWKRQARRSPD